MNLRELSIRLMRKGVDVQTLAECMDVPLIELETLRDEEHITVGFEDITEAMSRLAWSAYETAMEMLKYGTPAVKLNIIRMMLSSMRGLMGSQSPKELAALIAEFRQTIEFQGDDPDPDESDVDVDIDDDDDDDVDDDDDGLEDSEDEET